MKKTIERYGACFNLTLTGTPAELVVGVNNLFNYGIISNVPEDFDEKKDTCIMVQTDAGRMAKGFYVLAVSNLSRDKKFVAKFVKRKSFLAAVRAKRDQYISRFVPVGSVYENPMDKGAATYGQGSIHDFGWTQEFSTGT